MNPFVSTLMHALELFAVIFVAFLIAKLFDLQGEGLEIVVSVVLGGLVKFARAHNAVPLKDYVNKQ